MNKEQMIKRGDTVEAEIFKITNFGAFARLKTGQKALIHISQIADDYVDNISDYLKLGDKVSARVLKAETGKIDLTLKQARKQESPYSDKKEFRSSVFEDSLQNYLQANSV
jgi:S1 RNA binding domain protein